MSNKIIGMQVRHKISHEIGVVKSIEGATVTIDFDDHIIRCAYPAAFSSILELEDEELQAELEGEGLAASFSDFKRLYKISILHEIQYLKDTGGNKYRAVDGERLESRSDEYLYAFDTDMDYHFPDGTAIKIWLPDNIFPAYIVGCEDFTIVLRSMEYMGEKVNSIEFTAEQWALLEALNDRLDDLNPKENSIAYELACLGNSKIKEREAIICGQDNAFARATSKPITFIWGPPGTGKTTTLANVAYDYISNGNRVLMLSYSNVSVDGAVWKLAEISDNEPGQVIRYGYPRKKEIVESETLSSYQFVLHQNPVLAKEYKELNAKKRKLQRKDVERLEINKRLNKIREMLLDYEKDLVQNAGFVATTVSKAVIDKTIYSQTFDVVIFDEASMAYVPQIVFAASLARQAFLCLGDFKQLPAIVQNNEEIRLKEDIFQFTGISTAVENNCGHEWLIMLNVQHRMHKDIADFAGNFMYHGMLLTAEDSYEKRQEIANCEPLSGEPLCMLDLSGMYSVCIKTMDKSRINLLSALICVHVAEQLMNKYQVGIITPYSAQSRLILAILRDLQEIDERYKAITSATVHQFQGSEQSVIIYDAVDCYRMPYPGMLLTEVKDDTANRLFNVALTRAVGKFILVANRDFMVRKNISNKLMFTQAMNQFDYHETIVKGDEVLDVLNEESENDNILIDDRDYTFDLFINDINQAKKEVRIDIPGLIDDEDESMQTLVEALSAATEHGVGVIIRRDESTSLPEKLEQYAFVDRFIMVPVTIVDKRIIWFGHPLCAADFISEREPIETETYMTARFEGNFTARSLQAFLHQ